MIFFCMIYLIVLLPIQGAIELKKKVLASKSLFVSHMEAIQNVVRLHKAGNTANLEEISALVAANCCSLDQVSS